MATLRIFIAVPLADTITAHLQDLAASMAAAWSSGTVRWTHPNNMHLTLRFLGDTDPAAVQPLSAALDAAVTGMTAFQLTLAETCCVPSERRPRVVWVALADPENRLAALHRTVEQTVRQQGFPRERRRFKPHLTLGRMRDRSVPPANRWVVDSETLVVPVRAVELIQSRLKPSGAEYETLSRSILTGSGSGHGRTRHLDAGSS